MDSGFAKHFGVPAITSSLRHFFIGKGFTVISTVSVVFLLARHLITEEYAVYISWQALVLVMGMVTNAGIQAVLLRYLPELRSADNNTLVYRLIVIGVLARFVLIMLAIILLMLFMPKVISYLNQPKWEWLLPWYLIVGLLRLIALSLVQAMESLLWQRISQYSLAIASASKLFGVLVLIALNKTTLVNIVILEILSGILLLAILLSGLYITRRKDKDHANGDVTWWKYNNKRVYKYGFSKYLVNLSMLLYGTGPNRLLASNYLPSGDVATLGFADSLYQLFQKFMPSKLLIGLIRPVFMANFSISGDFNKLVQMSNMLLRINMLVLILAVVVVIVLGEPVFNWITKDKYGDSSFLLAGFLVLLVFEGLRLILELLIEAVEKNQISILCNLIQSFSIVIAVILMPFIGLWGLVVSNTVGTIGALYIGFSQLNSHGFQFVIDKVLCALIVVYGLISGCAGWLVFHKMNSIWISGAVIGAVYLILCVVKPPMHKTEIDSLIGILLKPKTGK